MKTVDDTRAAKPDIAWKSRFLP